MQLQPYIVIRITYNKFMVDEDTSKLSEVLISRNPRIVQSDLIWNIIRSNKLAKLKSQNTNL